MRGSDRTSGSLFSYVDLEERVPAKHPLRMIRRSSTTCWSSLDAEFERLYAGTGRPSIAPERLLRALLLQAFYTVRSERQLMEQLDYNLLFRWFVGLGVDEPVVGPRRSRRTATGCWKPRSRAKFLASVLRHPRSALAVGRALLGRRHADRGLGLDEELPAEGRQRRAALGRAATASAISTARSGRTTTHASTTDPEAKLYRKGDGKEAKLCFMGHALMENRNGLVVEATLTQATGTAEREAAIDMIIATRRAGERASRSAPTRAMMRRASSPI